MSHDRVPGAVRPRSLMAPTESMMRVAQTELHPLASDIPLTRCTLEKSLSVDR